jgi:hypothetical protein
VFAEAGARTQVISVVAGEALVLFPDLNLAAAVSRRLEAVYFVSLFGFVIWVGLLISWLFFSGVKPPLAS